MPRISIHSSIAVCACALTLCAIAVADPAHADIVRTSDHPTFHDALAAAGVGGHLIVDGAYRFTETLELPERIRITGTSPQGDGVLVFEMLSGRAITIDGPGDAYVVLENLDIQGLFVPAHEDPETGDWIPEVETEVTGLDLSGAHNVYLNNVTVMGFDVGIYGAASESVHVHDSNVSLHRTYNYHLNGNANSWRITGGLSSQSGDAAVRIELSNNTVIDSVRFESNTIGIQTFTESTHITNNRFECWESQFPQWCTNAVAVQIEAPAAGTVLVGNYYSGHEPVVDLGTSTYRFDPRFTVEARPDTGADGLRIALASGQELLYDADGRLRVGPQQGVSDFVTVNAPAGEDPLRVRADGITKLFVGQDGQVGVGTSTPTEQLQVNGNLRLDGDLLLDGDIVTTGEICIGSGC